ncbi:MAG: universal stress protein [Planctomycetota bacterium]
MYEHILVAVDESDHADKTLEQAARLAQAFQSRMTLVHAFPSSVDIVGSPVYTNVLAQRTEKGQQVLDEMHARLGDAGPQVGTELCEGPAADAVLSKAKELEVDLIVLGSRGLGTVERWLLGSVGHKVSHLAHCPVLIVR